MKKRKTHKYLIMLTSMIIWGSTNQVFAKDIGLIINGAQIITESKPVNVNGTILVPLRIIGEELGAGVSWDGVKKEITINKDNREIRLTIDSTVGYINSEKVMLSVPPKSINGVTMVPIRFVSESLECGVRWDNSKGLINIEAQGNLNVEEGMKSEGNVNTENVKNEDSLEEEVIEQDKNIYTAEYLEKLVEETPCSEEVKKFRSSINPRRNGLLKEEGKYFDIYYPNTEYAKEQLEIVKPHMDKAYMMLTDLYGIQAKVEVHFIDGEVGRSEMGQEGEIRNKENVTFVWLEPDTNDKDNGNISEIIHEMNHNFFAQVNSKSSNKRWMEEAVSKQIASLYTEYNYDGPKIEQWSFYDVKSEARNVGQKIEKFGLGFKDVDEYFRSPNTEGWDYTSDPKKRAIQQYALFICSYIYNTNDLDSYKQFLRNQNLKDGTTFDVIKRELGINTEEFENQIMGYMNNYKR